MRTLNRPMFRMGGPIKEGVMHGIREPHKHGGPTGTGLVGDQRYPQTGGREHHFGFLAPAAMAAARFAAPAFGRFVTSQLPRITRLKTLGKGKNLRFAPTKKQPTQFDITGGRGRNRIYEKNIMDQEKFVPYSFWANDPIYKAGVASSGIAGKAIRGGGRLIKGAVTTPTGLAITGATTYGFWPDGTPKTQEELLDSSGIQSKQKGPPGGGDPNMGYVDPDKAKKLAEQRKDDRVNSLLKTMGYDTAKRGAIGKALVDASQIVTERGTLDPKNITRELINPIIAATSKRLEKPEQLNEAVRLMLTKAEIEKEMNPLKDEESRLRIAVAKKTLAGSNFKEAVAAASKDGQLTGSALADRARKYLPGDFKVLNEKVPKKKDTLDFITDVVKKSHEAGKPFPPGQYVLKERVIVIDEQGNVTPLDL